MGPNNQLMSSQRSTGPMRRRGSFTATGTGYGRCVTPYFDSALYARLSRMSWIYRDLEGQEAMATGQARGRPGSACQQGRLRLTATLQAPEIQTMYSLNMPISTLRTKMRQEFERHRYVNQIQTVDVLLFNSHQEYQVSHTAQLAIRILFSAKVLGTGNTQLLEATVTCAQVLPCRRGAQGKATEQLHPRLLGGRFSSLQASMDL
ncbi:predicted protein [Plenodomus lingam JN3]|uniref:Predicted protein n=1 Tax=Leptosphaeria maculans (strain JN3 / isolate v23.1.3 / race Av1-4-5-6-7-8) TaxID=985895 RepID=E5AAX0_LEPMJ|nr:predicted protein [Plenodomus lingam JN3]CBY00811.1 predicted protein [Plenodomus lingam JN3]